MKKSDIQEFLIYSDSNKYHYYLLNWSVINSYVKNWSKNRIQCDIKVNEMYFNYFNDKHLHFFLHLAFDYNEKMVCYDGNHRMKVLDKIYNTDNIDEKIFISVMWNCDNDDIYQDFKNLNKQNVIPEMYILNAKYSDEFKKKVDSIIENYKNRYKIHLKTSNNPKIPNFETNSFKNDITNLYDKLPNDQKLLENVEILLNKYNNYLKQNATLYIKADSKVYQKCLKSDLWLFIQKPLNIDKIILLNNKL